MKRIWKPIVGYESFYEVSSDGLIWSCHRSKLLKLVPGKDGYLGVSLSKYGYVKRVQVHLLVLTAFVGPRPNGLIACHKDGNNLNNQFDNLL